MRKSCEIEINELLDKKGEPGNRTPVDFLRLLEAKYPSYSGEEVKFTEEALQSSNLKITLMEATVYYHPDKKTFAVAPVDDDPIGLTAK